MRIFLSSLLFLALLILSCTVNRQNSYYTGDNFQDSIMKSIDTKLKSNVVKTVRHKKNFGADSVVYYAVNMQTNQLVAVGFTDLNADSRTMYDLINGELIQVRYIPNHNKGNLSTIYYYEKGNLIYKRERNMATPHGEKFLGDISFLKKVLETR